MFYRLYIKQANNDLHPEKSCCFLFVISWRVRYNSATIFVPEGGLHGQCNL